MLFKIGLDWRLLPKFFVEPDEMLPRSINMLQFDSMVIFWKKFKFILIVDINNNYYIGIFEFLHNHIKSAHCLVSIFN